MRMNLSVEKPLSAELMADAFFMVEAEDHKVQKLYINPLDFLMWLQSTKQNLVCVEDDDTYTLWGATFYMDACLSQGEMLIYGEGGHVETLLEFVPKEFDINDMLQIAFQGIRGLRESDKYYMAFLEQSQRDKMVCADRMVPGEFFKEYVDVPQILLNFYRTKGVFPRQLETSIPTVDSDSEFFYDTFLEIQEKLKEVGTKPVAILCQARTYSTFRKICRDRMWVETLRKYLNMGLMGMYEGVYQVIHREIPAGLIIVVGEDQTNLDHYVGVKVSGVFT